MSKAFLAKKRNLALSKALAREHLTQIGVKATPRIAQGDVRLKPLTDAIRSSVTPEPTLFSRRLIRKLAAT